MTYLDAIKADIAYYKELRDSTQNVLDRLEIEVKILELEEKLMMAEHC